MPWAEETIRELEDTAVETYQTEKKKDWKKQNVQKMWGDSKKCNMHVMAIPEEERTEEIFEVINNWEISKIICKYQTTNSGSSQNPSRINIFKTRYLDIPIRTAENQRRREDEIKDKERQKSIQRQRENRSQREKNLT